MPSRAAQPRVLADGVLQVKTSPLSPNVYLCGETLIDAGVRRGVGKVKRQLAGHSVRALVLTHVHPPTQGASAQLCEELDLKLCCGAGDVEVAVSGRTADAQPRHWFNPLQQRLFAGRGHPVARALQEGDTVEEFEVLEVPGHSPGHIALWRGRDRVLILGDVLNNQNVWTSLPGLHEPPSQFTPDPIRNRESARRLASLRPSLALFSHGRPLRDPARLSDFVARLSQP